MSRWLRWLLETDTILVLGVTGFGAAIGTGLVGWGLASDIAMASGLTCLAIVLIGPRRTEPAASPTELRASASLAVFFAVLAVVALVVVVMGTRTFHQVLAVSFFSSFSLIHAVRSVQITRAGRQWDDQPTEPARDHGYPQESGQPGGDARSPSLT